MAADISIRWRLDVVGEGAITKVLAQDRALQRSLRETDAAYGRTGRAARTASAQQSAASRNVLTDSTRAARANHALGKSSTQAAREARLLIGAQDAVASAN